MRMIRSNRKKLCFAVIFLLFLIPVMSIGFFLANASTHSLDADISEAEFAPDIDFSELPPIDYETLNESWYNPDIEMIIVVPDGNQDFIDAVQPLCDWKNEKGVKTIILSNYSSYGQEEDEPQVKIREMIKTYYESDGIRWVLLAGDAQSNRIPIQEIYNPDGAPGETDKKPSDYYYAGLNGTWDEDGDGNFGESAEFNSNGIDEIDWIPEVYVGRLPASNSDQLEIMVNKIMSYEKGEYSGIWMNRMLLAGGISDTCNEEPPDGEDEARLTEYIWKNYVQDEMNFTHLYKTASFSVDTNVILPDEVIELDLDNFDTKFDTGYSTVLFAGHGSPTSFNSESLGDVYTDTDAFTCLNDEMPSLVYADACSTASYDMVSDNNIGEILIKENNAGAIGYIGALRKTWYRLNDFTLEMLNRGNAKLFWKIFFEEKKYQQGRALYDSKIAYIYSDYLQDYSSLQYEYERKNLLSYNLLGDPETDVYTNIPKQAINPFPDEIYEGQFIDVQIKDLRGNLVPYPRVHLRNELGAYFTAYGDVNGNVKLRLPTGSDLSYNITITGHNLLQSNFTFTTLSDQEKPNRFKVAAVPPDPSIKDNICFEISSQDAESGLESIFTYISNESLVDYTSIRFKNEYLENQSQFEIILNKLDPGNYQYEFFLIGRDYLNNTDTYEFKINFVIANPITDYYLIGGIFTIGAVSVVSSFMGFVGIKQYPKHIEKSKRT
ncbi:MAG: hypothetical protein GF311_11965 [Candidatus Lokiarchaeota archaeon]|nr:hypothetical protein [Candidatus Lokiarchaeota archaeon]